MTDPHYVNDLASLYASMHNLSNEERPLEEKYSHEKEPEWKKILRDEALKTRRQQPPYAQHHEPREDASEDEEASTAELAMKYVLELIGEAEHNEAAANALYMIRDLVK